MATWLDVAGYTHYAVRSDGAKWVNGQRDDTADTSWLDMTDGVLTLQAGVYDELLVVPYVADEAQIQAWYELQAPFYDATPVIDADGQTIVAADNHVVIDRRGLTVNDGTQDRVAVGDLSGRMFQGNPLPAGTYGLWTNNVFIEGLQLDPSIEDIDGAHDFDRVGGVAAGGSVHIGPAGITVTDGKIEITSSDGRTKFVGDRWEVYDDNDVLRVRIGRLD